MPGCVGLGSCGRSRVLVLVLVAFSFRSVGWVAAGGSRPTCGDAPRATRLDPRAGPGQDTESPGRNRCLVPETLQKLRNVSFFIRNQYYPKRLGATAPKLNLFSGCSRPWTFKSQYLRSPDAPRHPQDATRRPNTPPRRPKTRLRHLQVTILVDFKS